MVVCNLLKCLFSLALIKIPSPAFMHLLSIKGHLRNWIPYRVINNKDDLLCRWLYMGNLPYSDPFFDETTGKCLQFPENSKKQKTATSIDLIPDWAAHIDAVYPTAFIFHVSRCGSTLVSQALGMMSNTISLSEVPLFDEILRLPLNGHRMNESMVNELLAGAVKFYGAKRKGEESRLFIKTDSWHLLFYKQLRALYPDVPFIILYRQPGEVLDSNRRKKGIQGIASIVEPALYGFKDVTEDFLHPDNYMAYVLEQFYKYIIEIAANDKRSILLNYNEGLTAMMQRISGFTGIALSAEEQAMIAERSKYHAKHPGKQFVEQNVGAVEHPLMGVLVGLYKGIEGMRRSRFQK